MCLANTYFFLKGTARLWYENNEENLSYWEKFQEQLKIAFGSTELFIKQAERELKNRAQKTGESKQSYIQSVLELCHKVNPKMTENEKVSHLMKGVAEDEYQSLLVKDISCTSDFIKECQRIEEMNQRRIAKHRFTRLPNVVPVASIGEHEDFKTLIRHIVREEVQRMLAPAQQNTQLKSPSLEEVIREEVQQALCPVIPSRFVAVNRKNEPPRRPRTYAAVVRQPRRHVEPLPVPRQIDVWRTDDNRPVCFHCGRPGHVVRYCRERRAIFDAYRSRQASSSHLPSPNLPPDECSRQEIRTPSPIPSRGRSPVRRYRSPFPYGQRSPSRSPSRRNEEN
ncbi:CCHC-type domain-containing protein [Trichonephila clavata]|uniref:CCHC-type domain-containing protein n=1 Tax=Trichonephila clavata TaxID=2740835 RepID=A0A8X6HVL9_TRICU|nr:CCHC-type domain-containing protein [Trichonephila clavata]